MMNWSSPPSRGLWESMRDKYTINSASVRRRWDEGLDRFPFLTAIIICEGRKRPPTMEKIKRGEKDYYDEY